MSRSVGRIARAIALGLIVGAIPTHAALIWYESFNYPTGSLAGQGGWGLGGTQVVSPGYTYQDSNGVNLPVTGHRAQITGNTSNSRALGADYGAAGTTFYISAIMRCAQLGGHDQWGGLELAVYGASAGRGLWFGDAWGSTGGSPRTTWALQFTGAWTDPVLSTVPVTTEAFLVMKIETTSSSRTLSLWINPPLNTTEALAGPPAVTATSTHSTNRALFHSIQITANRTAGDNFNVDEIRFGSTWEAVTVPEPGSVVTLAVGAAILAVRRRLYRR